MSLRDRHFERKKTYFVSFVDVIETTTQFCSRLIIPNWSNRFEYFVYIVWVHLLFQLKDTYFANKNNFWLPPLPQSESFGFLTNYHESIGRTYIQKKRQEKAKARKILILMVFSARYLSSIKLVFFVAFDKGAHCSHCFGFHLIRLMKRRWSLVTLCNSRYLDLYTLSLVSASIHQFTGVFFMYTFDCFLVRTYQTNLSRFFFIFSRETNAQVFRAVFGIHM